jgi:hypothetical protein
MGLFGLFGKKENKVFSKEIDVKSSIENNPAEISGNIQLYNLTRIDGFYNHHEDGKFINEFGSGFFDETRNIVKKMM